VCVSACVLQCVQCECVSGYGACVVCGVIAMRDCVCAGVSRSECI
jgi:hypothetical protein